MFVFHWPLNVLVRVLENPSFEIHHPNVIPSLTDLAEGRYCTSSNATISEGEALRQGHFDRIHHRKLGDVETRKDSDFGFAQKSAERRAVGASIKKKDYARDAEGMSDRRR